MHRLAGNLFALVTTGPEKCCHFLTDVCKLFIWMHFIVCFASLLLLLVCNLLPRIFLFLYEIVVSPSHTHHLTHTFSKYETNQHLQQFTMVHCTLVMKNSVKKKKGCTWKIKWTTEFWNLFLSSFVKLWMIVSSIHSCTQTQLSEIWPNSQTCDKMDVTDVCQQQG